MAMIGFPTEFQPYQSRDPVFSALMYDPSAQQRACIKKRNH